MKKPNILIIMSDEQRQDTLGCYGNSVIKTPHIDSLAKEGMKVDNCFTPYPLCCPARASLWTGLLPHNHHVLGNWRLVRPKAAADSPVHAFAGQGYHTLYSGKWHVPGAVPEDLGFADNSAIPAIVEKRDRGRYIVGYRRFAEEKGYELVPGNAENLTRQDLESANGSGPVMYGTSEMILEDYLEPWQTGQFLESLDEAPKDKPFFAVVSYSAPHFPMVVPRPYDTLYNPDDITLPDNFQSGLEGKPEEVHASMAREVCRNLTEREWRELTAHYWGFCSLIDDQTGRIIEALKQQGLYDDTLILFTSDHGDMMGSHGLFMKKFECHYDEVTRIPLVIKPPKDLSFPVPVGMVSLIDIMPTLAEFAGISLDRADRYDGTSFAHGKGRDFVISETFRFDGSESGQGDRRRPEEIDSSKDDGMNISYRTREEKYIFHSRGKDEFYILSSDSKENINQITNPAYGESIRKYQAEILNQLNKDSLKLAELFNCFTESKPAE